MSGTVLMYVDTKSVKRNEADEPFSTTWEKFRKNALHHRHRYEITTKSNFKCQQFHRSSSPNVIQAVQKGSNARRTKGDERKRTRVRWCEIDQAQRSRWAFFNSL